MFCTTSNSAMLMKLQARLANSAIVVVSSMPMVLVDPSR